MRDQHGLDKAKWLHTHAANQRLVDVSLSFVDAQIPNTPFTTPPHTHTVCAVLNDHTPNRESLAAAGHMMQERQTMMWWWWV